MTWRQGWLKIKEERSPEFPGHAVCLFRDGERDSHSLILKLYQVNYLQNKPVLSVQISSDNKWFRRLEADGSWRYYPLPEIEVLEIKEKEKKK